MEQEISLLDLWKMFRKHLGKIIGLTLIGAALSTAFMFFFVSPEYESRTQLLVNQQQTGQSTIQLNEVQTNIQLINTYRDIIQGDSVLARVAERIGNQYTVGEIRDAIRVEQSSNSQAFDVYVTLESASDAQNILNEIVYIFEETIEEAYHGQGSIYVLSPPSYNSNAVAPSLIIYLLIGAFIGGALGVGIALIQELSDTTVKDDDFMTGLGLVNLGHVTTLSSKEIKEARLTTDVSRSSRKRV